MSEIKTADLEKVKRSVSKILEETEWNPKDISPKRYYKLIEIKALLHRVVEKINN